MHEDRLKNFFVTNKKAKIFDKYRNSKKILIKEYIYLLFLSIFIEIPIFLLSNFPSLIGIYLRKLIYSFLFKGNSKDFIIDFGVSIDTPRNITVGDKSWIGKNCILESPFGSISIGSNTHIGIGCILNGGGDLVIGNNVAIGAYSQLYSHSQSFGKKSMSGPFANEQNKSYITKKITIEDDVFIGSNTIITPGVKIGKGAVISANTFVNRNIKNWEIVSNTNFKSHGVIKRF